MREEALPEGTEMMLGTIGVYLKMLIKWSMISNMGDW